LASDRCRRSGRRAPVAVDHRQHPARQAQAELHPARRLRRPCRRHQRRQGEASPATSWQNKVYYRHTGYAGGIKGVTAGQGLEGRFPERVLEKAVERMIPRGPLGRRQMRAPAPLCKGTEHPHAGSSPSRTRRRFHESQEQGGCMMSDTVTLADLGNGTDGAEPCGSGSAAARLREQGSRCAGPRLCHRPPQGRHRPRLAEARHRQDHGQWPRSGSLFRPPDAAHRHQPAVPRSPTAKASMTSSPPSRAAAFRARPARSSTASARR
jgi:hypothetical protein